MTDDFLAIDDLVRVLGSAPFAWYDALGNINRGPAMIRVMVEIAINTNVELRMLIKRVMRMIVNTM